MLSIGIGGKSLDINLKWPSGITGGKKIRIKGDKYGLDRDISWQTLRLKVLMSLSEMIL